DLARRCRLEATFVEADAQHAADAVAGDVDLVYTSIGVVTWLPDLTAWAGSIARLLRPGGTFYIRDGHPMLYTLDDMRSDVLAVRYRYFPTGEAEMWQDPTSYTGEDRRLAHPRTYEWPHSLAEILGALLGAGLRVTSVGEQQTVPWQAHPLMEPVGESWAFPEPMRQWVPTTYSITAVKDHGARTGPGGAASPWPGGRPSRPAVRPPCAPLPHGGRARPPPSARQTASARCPRRTGAPGPGRR